MSKAIYQDVKWKGTMKWVKRGGGRFLHVRCTMDYDVKGTVFGDSDHLIVDCGNCGERLTVSNGNSEKPFFHRCRKIG